MSALPLKADIAGGGLIATARVLRRKVKRNHRFCDLRHRRYLTETPSTALGDDCSPEFYASSVVRLRAFPCRLRRLSTADGAARGWRRWRIARDRRTDGCSRFPLSYHSRTVFRSNSRATPEELKRISRAATMELRCKICKQRHVVCRD